MALNSNQFAFEAVQGQVDLQQVNANVFSCQIDKDEAATLVAGEAVSVVDSAGGVPKVEQLSGDTDEAFGFITRNLKDAEFVAENRVEIARSGTVIWMTAGAAIARGAKVEYDVSAVKVITSAGTNPIVGIAYDKAGADGDLIRVLLTEPVTP